LFGNAIMQREIFFVFIAMRKVHIQLTAFLDFIIPQICKQFNCSAPNHAKGADIIKNAFRNGEKLLYLFTIHYYLLPSKKSVHADLVKSEE